MKAGSRDLPKSADPRLVESGECASLSHAVRKIVSRYMREEERRVERPESEAEGGE